MHSKHGNLVIVSSNQRTGHYSWKALYLCWTGGDNRNGMMNSILFLYTCIFLLLLRCLILYYTRQPFIVFLWNYTVYISGFTVMNVYSPINKLRTRSKSVVPSHPQFPGPRTITKPTCLCMISCQVLTAAIIWVLLICFFFKNIFAYAKYSWEICSFVL